MKKHIFEGQKGSLHGWISPTGEYHHFDSPAETHSDWMERKHSMGTTEAMDHGWIAVGHGGSQSFSGANSIISNKAHPATKALRQKIGEHYSGSVLADVYHMGDMHSPSQSEKIDAKVYSRSGNMKPPRDDFSKSKSGLFRSMSALADTLESFGKSEVAQKIRAVLRQYD